MAMKGLLKLFVYRILSLELARETEEIIKEKTFSPFIQSGCPTVFG